MAVLPPQYLDAVVALGLPPTSPGEQPFWIGTGFLYGKHVKNDDYRPFIVTNKHVIKGDDDIVVAMNMGSKPKVNLLIERRNDDGSERWIGHPNVDVDLAITSVNMKPIVDAGGSQDYFRSDKSILSIADAAATEVAEGDAVFVLGFPLGVVGSSMAAPIVRDGVIARCRDLFAGTESEYLIDANVFPGNSGGPVILKVEMGSFEGTQPNPKSLLLGVARAYLVFRGEAISAQVGRPKVIFEENSGLAPVIPVDRIDETIDALIAGETEQTKR